MSKVYLTFDEMCNMKNQKDWVPEGLQFLSLKQVIIVLFCYLFKFIQIIKNNKGKSYKVKLVSEFFFELQKILKFYIFIYWSQISKNIYIFSRFPLANVLRKFDIQEQSFVSLWAWCTGSEVFWRKMAFYSFTEDRIFDILWQSHLIQTICSWKQHNEI